MFALCLFALFIKLSVLHSKGAPYSKRILATILACLFIDILLF